MKIAPLVLSVILLSIGVVCIFFSGRVQHLALRWVDRGFTANIEAAKTFMQSTSYIMTVKAVGAIAILSGAFVLWALFHNLHSGR